MKINLKDYTPKTEEIHIPEWTDEPLYVRELLGSQLEMLQRYSRVEDGKMVMDHQNALLIVSSLVDDKGDYLFTEKDIESIENQPAYILSKIIATVGRVSSINNL